MEQSQFFLLGKKGSAVPLQPECRARSGGLGETLDITYQPMLDLRRGLIDKCEVLARAHEAGADLAAYIASAERDGTIKDYTDRVIDKALADWIRNGAANVGLSINLSVLNLGEPDFVRRVAKKLKRHRFESTRLWFEFDDRAQATDDSAMLRTMSELAGLGVRLSIDGFGDDFTQATLYEAQRLPIAELKIADRYVRDADENMRHRNVITTTVRLANRLGIGTSAKGIERESIAALVTRIGCTHGQGYYFARPTDARTVATLSKRCRRPTRSRTAGDARLPL